MKIGPVEINKKLFITMIVILILSVMAFVVKKLYVNRYEKYKVNKKENFIYTYETYSNSKTFVPYVNINTDFCKDLNEQIQKLAMDYKDSTSSNYSMSYRFNTQANYVSLVIILKSLNENDELEFDFVTYVFDLNDKGKALTDEEILNKFDKNYDDIEKELENQMRAKYDYEIDEEIIPRDCDYEKCYLTLRNIDDYTDNANYYIENNELVVYRSFKVYSKYNEEDYFTRDDFKFYIY